MSDHNRKGWVSIDEGQVWLDEWRLVMQPAIVCLFGGEPLLNRDLRKWIDAVRIAWPSARLKIITNGFYLDRVPVLDWLTGPSELQVSLHFRNDPRRQQILSKLSNMMRDSKRSFRSVPTKWKHELLRFRSDDVNIVVVEFGDFRKPYAGDGAHMRPANGNPTLSHSKCGSPNNPILYRNRLYKCGPIANLGDTLAVHGRLDDDEWAKYLKYQGCASSDDLGKFVAKINKPEWICEMCPDGNNELIDHYAQGEVMEKREC